MGMSGNFFINDGSPSKWPMLTWVSRDVKLELLDHRRFAKWDFRDFNPDRGPDVVTEHVEFKKLIKDSISAGAKAFDKPLCEILLDQKYFNGIGNYLLAEILGRLNVNPFQKMNDLSKKKLNELLSLCKKIPQQAYVAGGAQLKDWKNPNKVSKKKFDKWKKFYKGRNCLSVVTDTGRNFWYHKKWNRFSKYGSED